VFSFYLVIAIGVTLGHMVMEYRYQRNSISRDLKEIQKTFGRGLAIDMWHLNQESLLSTVAGMLEIPVIVGVKIQDANNVDIAAGGIISQGNAVGKVGLHVSLLGLNQKESEIHEDELYKLDVFMHRFPIVYTYKGKTRQLGNTTIFSNTSVILRRVKLGFLLLIINAVVKTTALWFIFLWFSTILLRRPLASLTSATRNLSLENLDTFKVRIETSGRNELKILEESFNSMIGNLHHSMVNKKQAEEAMRKSEERYRRLVQNALVGIYQVSKEGSFIMINQKMAELFGYDSSEDFLEDVDNISNLYARPEERTGILREIDEQGFVKQKEVEFRKKGGGSLWVKLYTTAFIDEEKIIYEGLMEDVTEIIRADKEKVKLEVQLQQAQKMEAIGTLAGGIAHDFNNILSPIMGHSEMAMTELAPDNPIQHNLKEILKAGERARDMVKQILAFSRKEQEERTPIQLGTILKEAIKLLRSSIPTTIDIRHNIEAKIDIVFANHTQIHQVILNLCTNASHAMREKGGVLEIGLSDFYLDSDTAGEFENLNPGSYLRLKIKDTGHGIDPEVINRIFDPYFTTKEVGEGTGMGLSVAHGIVKGHGGDITVESELGGGTTFQVLFPKFDETIPIVVEQAVQHPKGTEKILFVDDEQAAVFVLQSMLENLGYEVTSRTSSIEALEAFHNNPQGFDLVITDMTMPNMTGKDLAKELMVIRPDIPIILCTGFSEQIDERRAEEIGISAFVMKPIVMRQIANTIREVLDNKERTGQG
jgi:PAS domain S-box-containing protein